MLPYRAKVVMRRLQEALAGHREAPQADASENQRHFVTDYNQHVAHLKVAHDEKTAMSLAIGGQYEAFGQIQLDLLRLYGLRDGVSLIDLACGSGRTATAVSREFDITYLGVDVVQDLIDYAARNTPDHYRYAISEDLKIPAADASADLVCSFSLFTHLRHEETYLYLEEVFRTLKPGGRIVFSFLEFAIPSHWAVFAQTLEQTRRVKRPHLNMFIERPVLELWAERLGFTVDAYLNGHEAVIPLTKPARFEDGTVQEDKAAFGQSVCVLRKP